MPFGKYRGALLTELPDDYLAWLAGLDDLREPLRSAIASEAAARGLAEPAMIGVGDVRAAAGALVSAGYRVLTREHHPDAGGDTRTMQHVNAAAAWLRERLRELAP